MKVLLLIPARMGSSRFPGKPLEKIKGVSMIRRVYLNSIKSNLITDTYVATCDKVIFNHIKDIGGKVVMTSKKHERATDRCAEALLKIEKIKKKVYDIVLMIQGDEPMVNKNMINEVLSPFKKNKNIKVANLIYKINNLKDLKNKNTIKVVKDLNNDAIYFSRTVIPVLNNQIENNYYKQVCLIPFKRSFLIDYIKMKPTKLEKAESIDMLRIIEHGFKVRLIETNFFTHAVDNKKDIKIVEKYI
jgi:3-deoxy-manno-octulosonate cytidylyltransferase (CMP-KDO synthetase)|tara:strand:- start:186 stop:920 length:735 start_codon:yes stop_codon:yes gene_type:complete